MSKPYPVVVQQISEAACKATCSWCRGLSVQPDNGTVGAENGGKHRLTWSDGFSQDVRCEATAVREAIAVAFVDLCR